MHVIDRTDMTTATIQKIKREIKQELMAEFLRPILERSKDPEGEYRKSFVKEVLRAAKRSSTKIYRKGAFLR